MSEEELELVLSKIDPHFQQLFVCLAYTGARPNEMLALRWSDVDWYNSEITKGRVRGHEGSPKTQAGERIIPMLPQVENALKEQRSKPIASADDYVFVNKRGLPIDKHLDRHWNRAIKQAGLRHRASYQLRHTFITQCIIKGFPLPYIAKIIGHTTIDTLIRHYAGWIDRATNAQHQNLKKAFAQSAGQHKNQHMSTDQGATAV